MKLNIVPASRGRQWVASGIRTFFRQPLALTGLFFLFMAAMSVLSLIPVLGNVLALTLLPGATLGLMSAAAQAVQGKFPKPHVLLEGFRSGKAKMQSMLALGMLYAAGFLLVLGISALVDGGTFAKLYLVGGTITAELLQEGDFEVAALLSMALYAPLSLMFWHAPALVHWHGVSPVKSLFFSLVACLRNFWAFTVYGFVWMGTFIGVGMVASIAAGLLGNADIVTATLLPVALILAAMFFTSIYFTFVDSFDFSSGEPL
jgi:hypothetical protein